MPIALVIAVAAVLCGCKANTAFPFGEHGTQKGTPALSPTMTSSPSPTATSVPSPTPTATDTPTPTPTQIPAEMLDDPNAPKLQSKAYIVTDGNGRIVLAKNAQEQLYPASTIKMLTALTAIDYKDLKDDLTAKAEQLVLDADVYKYGGYSAGAVPGMTYPMREWMHMLLISSCGDAANVIAGNVGGTIDRFMELMNQKAQSLGMTHTHVDNPIGLDTGNGFSNIYTTAEDMAKLSYAFYRNTALLEISGKAEYQVPDCPEMKGETLKSSNAFLSDSSKYHSDLFEVIGGKSGGTKAAGNCFVAVAKDKDGAVFIISVFGAPYGTFEQRGAMFGEIRDVLEYCFKNKK